MLYICTDGGCLEACLQLCDVIYTSKTPVYTINIGRAYSAGFYIMAVGHKRYAMPNSRFLLHEGHVSVCDNLEKALDYMKFNDNGMNERVRRLLVEKTRITNDMIDKKRREEWYMFASEAKQLGVVDFRVGTDCDIEEVA